MNSEAVVSEEEWAHVRVLVAGYKFNNFGQKAGDVTIPFLIDIAKEESGQKHYPITRSPTSQHELQQQVLTYSVPNGAGPNAWKDGNDQAKIAQGH